MRASASSRFRAAWVFGLLFACVCAKAQDSAAADLRQQATQLRTDASALRQKAKDWQAQADSRRKMAREARASATSWRNRGNASLAKKREQEAKDDEYEAEQRQNRADSYAKQAADDEKQAKQKDAEAASLEQQSSKPVIVVFRMCAETISNARDELRAFEARMKQHVGREHMSTGPIYSFARDDQVKVLTEAEVDERAQKYEDTLAQIEKKFTDERAAVGRDGQNLSDLMYAAYTDTGDAVRNLFLGIFSLEPIAYEDYYAGMYRQERKFDQEYKDLQEQLRNNHTPYEEAQAQLQALKNKQSLERRPSFDSVAKRFRSDKNYLAFLRHEWIQEVSGLHDLAVKLSKGNDVHARAADDYSALLSHYFTDYKEVPMSFGLFLDGTHNFLTPYDGESWCVAGLYPDIQAQGAPDLLNMNDVLNEKLPFQVSGRKDPGAAGTRKP